MLQMTAMTDQEIFKMVATWRNIPVYQRYEMFWHNLNFRANKTVSHFVRSMITSGYLNRRQDVYHNDVHCMEVMLLADRLYSEISGEATAHYALLCASIAHDAGHSLGKACDDVNIQNAIEIVNEYFTGHPTKKPMRVFLKEVTRLISITRYPFLSENEPVTLAERCIRDADLMYAMHPNDLESRKILERLTFEMTGKGFDTHMDYVNAREKQIEFFAGCTMYTDIGKAVRQEFIKCHANVQVC